MRTKTSYDNLQPMLKTMKFEQHKVYKDYCIVCGKDCKAETCTDRCKWRLEKVRSIIKTQKETESGGIGRKWNDKTIRDFNKIQEIIG